MFVDNYYFKDVDIVIDDGDDCYMDIIKDRLFELALLNNLKTEYNV